MNKSHYEVGDKPNGGEGTGQSAIPPTIRKCEFCGKEFNSGKAFGGHKRFHLQAQRKLDKANTNKANCNSSGKLNLSCYLCNMDFPYKKSLFGHMRCHPDRNWRSVHPPTPTLSTNKHSSCSSNFEPAFDVSRYLPKSWKKTNKRGKERVLMLRL